MSTKTGFFSSYIDNVALASYINDPHTVYLVSSLWNYSTDTSSSFNEIPPAALLASAPLENRAVDKGVLIADHLTFPNLQSGTGEATYLVVVNDVTQDLVIAFDDVSGVNEVSTTEAKLFWNECGIGEL